MCAGELDFRVSFGTPLTDELLGVVVGMGSRVRTLTCPSLALHSKRDARTPWQWERLTCETLDLGQLHRLPEPRRGQTCVVCVEELVVGEDTAQVSCFVHTHTHTHTHTHAGTHTHTHRDTQRERHVHTFVVLSAPLTHTSA